VTLTMTGEADAVEVVVADEGTGMDPAMIPKLFQFGATTKGERGNGMGLWVVKKLMDKHGGTIGVESKLGKGTRFTLIWPRQIAFAQAIPGMAIAPAHP